MASISTLPAHPIAGKAFRLTATATAGGNAIRIWCTAAPQGSKLRKDLDESGASRVGLHGTGTVDAGRPLDITLDKGGAYVLLLEELQRGSGFRGGYQYDTRGAPTETIVDSDEVTLGVASPMSCPLGFAPDTATLRLFVSGAQIIATTREQHGMATPTIELGTQATARARTAAEATAVREAVAALVGTATVKLGTPAAAIADLITKYNLHRRSDNSHLVEDTNNSVDASSFGNPESLSGQAASLNKLRDALSRHIRNVDPGSATPEPGSLEYHGYIDWADVPLDQVGASASDAVTVMLATADTWRCYEGHRVSDAHSSHDDANAAAALSPLLALHREFIAQLAALSPTTPPTEHSAASLLANAAGFKDA